MRYQKKFLTGGLLAVALVVAGGLLVYILDTETPVVHQEESSSADNEYLSVITQKYPDYTILDYTFPSSEESGSIEFAAIAQGKDGSQTNVFVVDDTGIGRVNAASDRLDFVYIPQDGIKILPQDRISFTVQHTTSQQVFDYEILYQKEGKDISYRVSSQLRD